MNPPDRKPLDVAAVNSALFDAERNISQARGALGGGDSSTALYRLERALAVVKRSIKDIKG